MSRKKHILSIKVKPEIVCTLTNRCNYYLRGNRRSIFLAPLFSGLPWRQGVYSYFLTDRDNLRKGCYPLFDASGKERSERRA